jgi:leader peptidase (prepilin peptidase)/N-methyltransferase
VNTGLVVACSLAGAFVGAFVAVPVARVPERRRVLEGAGVGAAGEAPVGREPEPAREPEVRGVLTPPFPELRPWLHSVTGWVWVVVTAALFGATAERFGEHWILVPYLVFVGALVPLTIIDLRLQILPNRIVYPLAGASVVLLGLVALVDSQGDAYVRALLAGVAAFVAFCGLHLVAPGGLGFGDVKLSFVLGLYLGWLGWGELVLGVFLAFLYGAVVGIALIVTKVRSRRDAVPFGPFLAAGAMTAVLFGTELLDLYRH